MNASTVFHPGRARVIRVTLALIGLLLGAAGWSLWRASLAELGLPFFLLLLPVAAALLGVPVLAYLTYAVYRAAYRLERDAIYLQWGLRAEDLPIEAVLWVHAAAGLASPQSAPWSALPGTPLAVRQVPGLGEVEYLAAPGEPLVFIATPRRVYAISPADPTAFLADYARLTEYGALTAVPPRSIYPTLFIGRVWGVRTARRLLTGGFALNLLLTGAIALAVGSRERVLFGAGSSLGASVPAAPAVRLFLLAVLSTAVFLVNALLGLFFFRRGDVQPEVTPRPHDLAYLLWLTGLLTPLLFLIGLGLILLSPG
jgi:hypothetical protein